MNDQASNPSELSNRESCQSNLRGTIRVFGFILGAVFLASLSSCGGCGKQETKPKRAKSAGTETSYNASTETTYNPLYPDQKLKAELTPLPTPEPPRMKPINRDQVLNLEPQAVGTAKIGLLDSPLGGAAGNLSTATAGDYLLTNGKISLYFAAVKPRKKGEPFNVILSPYFKQRQGSLIDLIAGDVKADYLGDFTQALGTDASEPVLDYDSAEFIKRDNPSAASGAPTPDGAQRAAVGLRLTGSTFNKDDREIRVQTIYWLVPDETRVEVETKILEGDQNTSIADTANWGPGVVLTGVHGVPDARGATLDVDWFATHAGNLSIGVAVFEGQLHGNFARSRTRTVGYKGAEGSRQQQRTRWIFAGVGNYDSVDSQIFQQDRNRRPTGVFQGKVIQREDKEPAPGTWVDVYWYDRKIGPPSRQLFEQIGTDANGNFRTVLPMTDMEKAEGRFFIGAGGRSRQIGMEAQGIVVKSGSPRERTIHTTRPALLHVQVFDSKTSQTVAARVKFEPVPPASAALFDGITSPTGYLNYFYVPPEGRTVEMSDGVYTLTAMHGIRCDFTQVDVQMAYGQTTSANLAIQQTSPTPGWLGVQIGALTNATPDCVLTPEDVVLMAAAEDLDWIVTGDDEKITDLSPVISKMGLQRKLGSSRGFRTRLPKRPEWGDFLVYPVPSGAPDPKVAREQWKNMTQAADFIGALRRLYPGALIEAVHLYSEAINRSGEGNGYFFLPKWNVYEMAFNDNVRTEPIDFSIDAVNVCPSDRPWVFGWEKDFVYINTLRSRFYIPAPVSDARVPFLSEPGYPRLLVRTDQSDPSQVTEKALFDAMKAGHWQVTSGPFIEFKSDGRKEGELYQPGKKAFVRFKLTAPLWATMTHIEMCKDGVMLWKQSDTSGVSGFRKPFEWEGQVELNPELKSNADTLLSVTVSSEQTVEIAPRSPGMGVPSMAWMSPVIADTNGNAKWDPPQYRDKGR